MNKGAFPGTTKKGTADPVVYRTKGAANANAGYVIGSAGADIFRVGAMGNDNFEIQYKPTPGGLWLPALSIDKTSGLASVGNLGANNSGCGRLSYVSTTQIKFSPYNGDKIKINGTWYTIPTAGVVASNSASLINGVASALIGSTLYYVYLFNSAGVLTIDFSTTGHSTDNTPGNIGTEIKAGDGTRTLIGMILTDASGSAFFRDSASTGRWTLSWFNRRTLTARTTGVGTITTTSSSMVEVTSGFRAAFLSWADESTTIFATGFGSNSATNAGVGFCVVFDGAGASDVALLDQATAGFRNALAAVDTSVLSEGSHYASIFMRQLGGAGTVTLGNGIIVATLRG